MAILRGLGHAVVSDKNNQAISFYAWGNAIDVIIADDNDGTRATITIESSEFMQAVEQLKRFMEYTRANEEES